MRPPVNRILLVLVTILLAFAAFGGAAHSAGGPVEQQYKEVLKKYRAALSDRETTHRLGELDQCIASLGQVIREDAGEKLGDRSHYLLAQCRHARYDATRSREDFRSALENYKIVVQKYHDSSLADDAQYLMGVLYLNEDPSQAYIEFAKVGIFFPGGDMHRKSSEMTAKLQKSLQADREAQKGRTACSNPAKKAGTKTGAAGAAGKEAAAKSTSAKGASRSKSTGSRPSAKAEEACPPGRSSMPSLARQLGLDVRRIVIDPGHGGKDKGASGPNRVYEKDLTLSIARELKKVIEQKTKCDVFLTRTDDRFVSLEDRTAFANAQKADLFISIHTNAHEDKTRRGTETYFLNLAKDKESARVAAFENASSQKKMSDLEAILRDLMRNTRINESSRLAKDVQANIVNNLKPRYKDMRDLGTKQAPFYVLVGAEMPSILVETAFITNDREEHLLKDRDFQKNVAAGISGGVESYIRKMRSYAQSGDKS
jgi:N-acetylmuramoyl-L-alanine amidase